MCVHPTPGASVSDAAFALLPVALDSRHGNVAQTLAVVANKLVPTLVGADGGGGGGGGGKRGGGGQAVDRRGAALGLVNSLLRCGGAVGLQRELWW